jgi:lipoyl(octanoyl) transferase
MITWRLIDTGSLDGASNMAVDEAILACFNPSRSRPVLRLYGWKPAAFSLGRFQKGGDVLDLEKCKAAGVKVVRRITGGGAIYHTAELTYSIVCAPHQIPPAPSVKDSYRLLTGFLLLFYERLGLTAGYAADHLPAGTRLGERTDFCFAGKEACDILINRKKIGGNAQRRMRNVIFQHGSIPVGNRLAEGTAFLLEIPPGLAETTATLRAGGVTASPDELKKTLIGAFRERVAPLLEPDLLTEEEKELAERLRGERYEDNGWNLGGNTACG